MHEHIHMHLLLPDAQLVLLVNVITTYYHIMFMFSHVLCLGNNPSWQPLLIVTDQQPVGRASLFTSQHKAELQLSKNVFRLGIASSECLDYTLNASITL